MRVYFKVLNGDVHIYFRPTHDFIGCVKRNKPAIMKKEIAKYIECSLEDFFNIYIVTNKVRLKLDKFNKLEVDKDRDEWLEKAWMSQTKLILDSYKLSMPNEKVEDFIEMQNKLDKLKVKSGWDLGDKEVTATKDDTAKRKKVTKKTVEGGEDTKTSKTIKKDIKETVEENSEDGGDELNSLLSAINKAKKKVIKKKK